MTFAVKYQPTQKDNLRATLQAMPKIDLHRHLEGSLRLSTLAEIARQHGVDMRTHSIEELRPLVQVTDEEEPNFQTFLAKFAVLRKFYSTREAVMRIAYEVVADAAHDNVKYLEIRFNPVAQAYHQGFSFEEVADWVIEAVNRARRDFNILVRLIVQMGRHEPQFARRLAELAVARQKGGIVALDLAGDEEHYSAGKFIDVLRWAKRQGMHITAHAGECRNCPAENVREAIEVIQADRIGHGVQARGNLAVIDLLRRKQIPLEMCPTSNLQTAAIDALSQHPLLSFHRIGIPVTINTDDPSVSNITLTDEYMVAVRGIGVPFTVLKEMILNAARAAFVPQPERERLVRWFEQTLNRHNLKE
ncbi:MAG: adenosine deaminase [Caldilineae bacterium]|nr:MAG: adenosine deaminase [Caldilineae bacterium]